VSKHQIGSGVHLSLALAVAAGVARCSRVLGKFLVQRIGHLARCLAPSFLQSLARSLLAAPPPNPPLLPSKLSEQLPLLLPPLSPSSSFLLQENESESERTKQSSVIIMGHTTIMNLLVVTAAMVLLLGTVMPRGAMASQAKCAEALGLLQKPVDNSTLVRAIKSTYQRRTIFVGW